MWSTREEKEPTTPGSRQDMGNWNNRFVKTQGSKGSRFRLMLDHSLFVRSLNSFSEIRG